MPIKPHMCHFTYVTHVYVIKAYVKHVSLNLFQVYVT